MNTPLSRAAVSVAIGWLLVFISITLFRPLMPVDETRYLSVAWEMLVSHHWILPTLNFEPYPHKPPLLFWLIRLSWMIFGVNITAPRIFIFAAVGVVFYLTTRLARALFPQDDQAAARSILLLTSLPVFLIYASVIMFDSVLTVFVLIAVLSVWRAAQTGGVKPWIVMGVALGFGILAKGPVALIYTLPVAFLAPLWTQKTDWKRWYGGIGIAFVIGAAIGLAWAIPAAIQGGPAYAEKIFVTQSARRMVEAFDHVRPFWFYIPILAGFLLPLLTWPTLWIALRRQGRSFGQRETTRFLLCWIIPAFVFFSIISSKQIHYMVPILPGFALLGASLLSLSGIDKARSVAIPMALMLIPSLAVLVYEARHIPFMGMKLKEIAEHAGYVHIALSAGLLWWARKDATRAPVALSLGAFLMAIMIHVQLGQGFLPRYDLSPLAGAIAPYKDRPYAAAPKYDGEYGFMLRTQKPIVSIGREDIEEWLAENPTGIVIARYKPKYEPDAYKILFKQEFRPEEELLILEKK